MAKTRASKAPAAGPTTRKQKLTNPEAQPNPKKPKHEPIPAGSDSDSDIPSSPTRIQALLEPYSKDQLISFLLDAAGSDPSLRARIRSAADADVSHRKIFVHGLGWDTTTDDLLEAMAPFGTVEECKVVVDRVTGRAKGFGFVQFATRSAAVSALKEPQKKIKNRMASFQLASTGPVAAAAPAKSAENLMDGRRIYVSKVPADAAPDRLKEVFAKYGEIESGPIGFDSNTGKSRGFAIFVYRNQDSAKKALEEPNKPFEGQMLYCQIYTPNKGKQQAAPAGMQAMPAGMAPAGMLGAAQQPMLAAMAQNMALFGYNPAYSMLLAQNPLLAAAAMNQGALMQGYGGGMTNTGTGSGSVLGAYGQGQYAALQGMQGFPGATSQSGQGDVKTEGSFGGFPSSYVW